MARRTHRHLPIFFLDVYENDDYMETDNEAEAYARFYACPLSCILYQNGRIVADKEFVEMEVEDSAIFLSAEITGEGEHADLEEVEAA